MTTPDAGQAKPSSRSDSDVNTRLIEDLRDITQIMHNATAIRALAAEAASTIERLRGVEDDALRYRWLREHPHDRRTMNGSMFDLDELIDMRMQSAASRSTGAADVGEDHG